MKQIIHFHEKDLTEKERVVVIRFIEREESQFFRDRSYS